MQEQRGQHRGLGIAEEAPKKGVKILGVRSLASEGIEGARGPMVRLRKTGHRDCTIGEVKGSREGAQPAKGPAVVCNIGVRRTQPFMLGLVSFNSGSPRCDLPFLARSLTGVGREGPYEACISSRGIIHAGSGITVWRRTFGPSRRRSQRKVRARCWNSWDPLGIGNSFPPQEVD